MSKIKNDTDIGRHPDNCQNELNERKRRNPEWKRSHVCSYKSIIVALKGAQ